MASEELIQRLSVAADRAAHRAEDGCPFALKDMNALDSAAAELARLTAEVGELEWFGQQRRLSLYFYSPVYADDDDQDEEWRVDKEGGSINDREWDTVGRGATPLEAISAARAALSRNAISGEGGGR